MDFGAKKGLEMGCYVAKLGTVSNLVNKTEPTVNACGRGWRGEILDSIQIFRQGLNGFIRSFSGLRTIPERPTRIQKAFVHHQCATRFVS